MNYFERRKILTTINTLDLIPLHCYGHEVQDNRIIVFVPKFSSSFVHALFPKTAKLFFRVKLDKTGTKAWEAIDGHRNVKEICEFIEKNADDESELKDLEKRLSKYIMILYEKRLISFKQLLNN